MYCLLQPFKDISSIKLPYLDKMPDTKITYELEDYAGYSCNKLHCQNWSIYEEHWGNDI